MPSEKNWHHWKGVAGARGAWPCPGHLPILFQATDHTTPEQSLLRDQVPVQQQTDPMLDYCESYLRASVHQAHMRRSHDRGAPPECIQLQAHTLQSQARQPLEAAPQFCEELSPLGF